MSDDQPPRNPQRPPPLPPRFDAVRPGIDRPEDRPLTVGRPATRRPVRPPYDPSRPPIGSQSRSATVVRRSRGWMVLGGLAAFVGLAVVVAVAALALAPLVDFLRAQAIAQVKAKTGRDLTIAGPVSLAVFPELKLTLNDVALSAPVGMETGPLVTMAALEASVRLLPLLNRQISIDRLTLHRPVFELAIDKSGKRSWDFAGLTASEPARYAEAKPQSNPGDGVPDAVKDFVSNASDPDNPSPQTRARLARLEELTLGDVRIDGGAIHYGDDRVGVSRDITQIDARVGLKSLASPLDATGSLTYANQAVTFDVKLASLKALLEDRPAKLIANVTSTPLEAHYDGTMTTRSSVELDGDLDAKAPSLRALTLWLGHEMPPADGFGPVVLAGKLKTAETSYTLTNATLGLDGQTATGLLLLDLSGQRPRINANLKISAIDLNLYTLAAGHAVAPPSASRTTATAAPPHVPVAGTAAAKSIEDLISGAASPDAAGPRVKGYTRRAGWSEERIPLDALGLADADAKISVGQLRFHDITVGASTGNVSVKSKVLRVALDDVQLYDGRGRGFVQLDANPSAAVVGANLTLDGVAAQGLLKDVAGFDLIAGKARVAIAVGAQGASEAALVASTNGKADFAFTDGAIVGYNIPGTLRGLSQGKFSGFSKSDSQKTDFSELAGSFTIASGIASNQDMRFVGPLLRVTGAGQIALPAQSLDYTIKPKLVASLDGQGSTSALDGVEVPVRINGPWAAPEIAPDLSGVLKDPNKAIDAVKSVAKQLKDSGAAKGLGNAVKGLLGKGSADGGTTAGAGGGETSKAKDFLNKLFNKN